MQNAAPTPAPVNPFTALTKYAQFDGRSRRSEFWLWVLISSVISSILSCIDPVLPSIWSLAVLIPTWAVFCRRMHDTGRSGWNWLWLLVPIAGVIILLVFECQDSQPGYNKYGANPKGIGNEE